nr:protein kinase [Ktedonobacteraceae bacterium]
MIPAQTQLRSHVGWRLLHARVRELGKEALIISSDRQIRSVVKAAGFRVTDSLESSATSKNRSSSRMGRSGLGGRPPSRVRTPPRRDVPGQRTDASPEPEAPSTPPIRPLEPSYQDEEPDLFLEDFRRAQRIREAAEFGLYSIVRLLGQGDMGKVYFAENSIQQSDGTWRKQSVAVKVLRNWYDEDIFRNHARKMTKLQHANILSTLLFGVKEDAPYLVMQYASQGTLLTRHPRGTILPHETILSYVKQIASALQYAHERDMFGDVRPKKMFVGKDNRILVSGFDVALNTGADPGRMVAKDYFEYRAPEQTQAFLSAACNQYALGVIVYEWLCGDVPFQGESVQIIYQHNRVTPPSLREQNPAIPHEVEEVVMKALAKDPEQRYESIQEFAEALEEAILPPKADRFVLPDRSGEQFGQYRLERLLGVGGFAEVYLGKHVKLDTFTAIKVLHTRLSVKELEAFEKEAKVIASLRHPSIVRVLDYDAQGNIPFLVMDHAPEGTMRQFHARGSRLSLPTVVKYVKQIAEALQFAHNKKIIHRDVKPENMLIESQDTIMLSDFGLAVVAQSGRSWRVQDKAGTAQYMAPEQFRGKAIPASDQYSLAVTAYEWLCGAPPFDEGNEIQLGFQHTMEPVPPMSERGAVVSEGVEQVILKALAKEPTERFGSVKEFAEALEKAAQVD